MQKASKGTDGAAAAPILSKRHASQMLAEGAGQAQQSPILSLVTDERFQAVSLALMDARTEGEFITEIARLWREAQDRFLAIGRYLVRAHERLGKRGYQQMLKSEGFPFSRDLAYKLKTVAEAVDGGKVSVERLPRDYSVAYMLVTLTDQELRVAEKKDLVRADVKRREVEEFRRSLRRDFGERRLDLQKRRELLVAKIRQMQDELRRVDEELGGDLIEGDAVVTE
jgi:hypothetical protein